MTQVRKPSYQVSKEKKFSAPVASRVLLHPTQWDTYPPTCTLQSTATRSNAHISSRDEEKNKNNTKINELNVLVFGVSSVESLGEAVLKSSPWWAAGGRPRGSFFFVCVDRGGRGFEHRLARKEMRDGGRGGSSVPGTAEGGSLLWFPPSAPPAAPLRLTGGFSPLVSGEGLGWCGEGVVEVVLLALSLERASQFIKAFGERGRNLHVT